MLPRLSWPLSHLLLDLLLTEVLPTKIKVQAPLVTIYVNDSKSVVASNPEKVLVAGSISHVKESRIPGTRYIDFASCNILSTKPWDVKVNYDFKIFIPVDHKSVFPIIIVAAYLLVLSVISQFLFVNENPCN